MSDTYILDGHEPVPEPDVRRWGAWFESADRIVAQTVIGDVQVSTVFLGLDHNWSPEGTPLLFETMIFGGPLSDSQWRYPTWASAERGHARAVRAAKKAAA